MKEHDKLYPVEGCAALYLYLEGNSSPEVCFAAVKAAERWPFDHQLPQLDPFRCPWCGDMHHWESHRHKAATFMVGRRLFGSDWIEFAC